MHRFPEPITDTKMTINQFILELGFWVVSLRFCWNFFWLVGWLWLFFGLECFFLRGGEGCLFVGDFGLDWFLILSLTYTRPEYIFFLIYFSPLGHDIQGQELSLIRLVSDTHGNKTTYDVKQSRLGKRKPEIKSEEGAVKREKEKRMDTATERERKKMAL